MFFFNSTKDVNAHCHDRSAKLVTLDLSEYNDCKLEREDQQFMVGLHPWNTVDDEMYDTFDILSTAITDPRVVGIGEVGIDPLHGASVERQEQLLRYQLRVANEARLPVMFHIVRRYDILIKLFKELKPVASWAVHGFRSSPEVASQLADLGIYMSIGLKFNLETLKAIPRNLILLETDELPDSAISDVINAVAQVRGRSRRVVSRVARENLRHFLNSGQKSL